MNERENYIRAATFNHPEKIPVNMHISDASWLYLGKELEDIAIKYPDFFKGVSKGWMDYENMNFAVGQKKGEYIKDAWDCIWHSSMDGITGCVVNSPLTNWDDLDNLKVPDPLKVTDMNTERDWDAIKQGIKRCKAAGNLATGRLFHGFLLLRILYLRGFENAMIDFADEEPRLQTLIDKIVDYNMVIVQNYLNAGVEFMNFPEDLGTQTSTIISPHDLRRWIFPAYRKLIKPCKEKGILTFMHSDGYTIDILEEIIDLGIDIVNPQDLCNGIDNLEKRIKGKACICLDIDRQRIIPFGTGKEIHELIEEEVKKLGDPKGGLMFLAGIYPPTPPENITALCEALQKYQTYWS